MVPGLILNLYNGTCSAHHYRDARTIVHRGPAYNAVVSLKSHTDGVAYFRAKPVRRRAGRLMMPDTPETAKLKVCLVGDEGVGKTSLIRQFVLSEFDERYVRTVGVVVHKRIVLVPVDGTTYTAYVTVWDILGRNDFAGRYGAAYFAGTGGVLAVCDLTRPETLDGLGKWLDLVYSVAGEIPTIVLANKRDLEQHVRVDEDELLAFCELY